MVAATFLATFLIPMFFVVVREKFSRQAAVHPGGHPPGDEVAQPDARQVTGGIPLAGDSGAEGHRP
jgi:hypothetical protein